MLGRDGGLTLSGLDRGRYDARVTSPRRLRLLGLAVAVVLSGCAAATSPKPSPTGRPTAAPNLTPVPGGPSNVPSASPVPTSEAEGFGPIWDALPPSWPTLPGQSQSEVGTDASEGFVVKGDPEALIGRLRDDLEQRGWTVDVGSPLEDGTIVLEATGPAKGCTAEARLAPPAPGDNIASLLVYYGASCPFN